VLSYKHFPEHRKLDKEQREYYSRLARAGDMEARDVLAMSMVPVVRRVCGCFATNTFTADDLFSYCMIDILSSRYAAYDPKWSVTTAASMFARNTCINVLRKEARRSWLQFASLLCEQKESTQSDFDKAIDYCKDTIGFYRKLPKHLRDMVRYRVRGLNWNEVRDKMRVSFSTINQYKAELLQMAVEAELIQPRYAERW
jgi:DNA-directed RNA polymerase specialized sigma24 family protein